MSDNALSAEQLVEYQKIKDELATANARQTTVEGKIKSLEENIKDLESKLPSQTQIQDLVKAVSLANLIIAQEDSIKVFRPKLC